MHADVINNGQGAGSSPREKKNEIERAATEVWPGLGDRDCQWGLPILNPIILGILFMLFKH